MDSKEFDTWLARNEGKGGKKISYDPFNKAKKGSERNPAAQEFANVGIEEYHKYSERRETRRKDDERQDDESQSRDSSQSGQTGASRTKNGKSSRGAKSSGRSATRVVQNIVGRAAAVIVSAVVVVAGYQEIKAHEEAKALAARTVTQIEWVWNDDNTTATAELFNVDGNLISETPAVITVMRTEATCNTEGRILYTATVTYSLSEDEEQTYFDTHTEIIPPTGHEFDEGRIVDLDNGQKALIYECMHCHEEFSVSIVIDEE